MTKLALVVLLAGVPALLAAGCRASAPAPPGVASAKAGPPAASARVDPPPAIAAEGVPAIPRELSDRLRQYHAVRGAGFEDWGPEGSILVTTRFAETSQIHLVPFPGGRREQLTFFDEPVANAVFVRGETLYSQARGGDENYQIYRLDRKTGRGVLLTDGKSRNLMGPPSRKGDKLVFSSNRRNGRDMDLYLLDVPTGAAEPLLEVSGEFWVATDWSPDDARLLLLRIVSVNENLAFVLDLKTRKRSVIPVPGEVKAAHGSPRFLPSPQAVVLASDARGDFKELAVVGVETGRYAWVDTFGGRRVPWDVTDVEIGGPTLAAVTNEDGASRLYLVGPESEGAAELPLGIVSGLKFSPDGRRLGFTLSRPDAPPDAYTYEIAEKKLVRWTFSEVGGLDPASFVTPSRFEYKSFDGRDVPAYLYLPRGARKAPVVVSIHGGPEGQYRPAFSGLTQYWVNELGLAVIAPNVRGSTGYGKTYVALDNGERREDAVKDIGALLDWIARQPELDASRVAVTGGSYGGYMVLASLVHFGDRLRAGVDVVGIANFTTFLSTTSGYRVDLRRVEYGDERQPGMREFFERISPANHADRIRSALLVAHGRNDPRVPFSEAEQIVARVRARGKPVWTVYAANEGHGFARKENRDYLNAATTMFFRAHLLE